MKLRLTVSKVYDITDEGLLKDYNEWMLDYPRTLSSLEEFLIDRFVAPHFDNDIEVDVQIETGDEDADD